VTKASPTFGKTVSVCLLGMLATQRMEAAAKDIFTFGCRGQVTIALGPLEPFSKQDTVRLIVNVPDRTVSFEGDVVPFIQADDGHIKFGGENKYEHTRFHSSATVHGQFDRISGALVVHRFLTFESYGSKHLENYDYKMQCKSVSH
jgi:hypothetical protein